MKKKKANGAISFKGQYHIVVKDQYGNVKHDEIIDNITTSVYREVIADNMTNASPVTPMLVNYIAVGTGTNTPVVGDTQLQTENARKLQTSRTNSGNVAAIATVFNAGDVPASTLREVGLFANGTGTANSGTLVSRAAINIVVTALDSVFIDYRITINDA
jgi:hypothetical protein